MRLDHLLGTLGFGSRTQVKGIVRAGRVQIAGQTAGDPGLQVDPDQVLHIDGQRVDTRLKRHLMMNKPAGVLTAARDKEQRTVLDLLPPLYRSLGCMPIGRLDKETEGLLLFTTDGQMAHRLLSPKSKVAKRYQAEVEGRLSGEDVDRFQRGIPLSDFVALPADLHILSALESVSLAEVTVYEGKFHQVRRMFGACGHEVIHLRRMGYGPLVLDPALAPGGWRELDAEEWESLLKEAQRDG